MLGLALDGGNQRQHLVMLEIVVEDEIGQRRLALGQRAGLVEGDDPGVAQLLQRFALAEQHAQFGGAAGADHDRGRRGQAHGTGAGDDQHRHGIDQAEG